MVVLIRCIIYLSLIIKWETLATQNWETANTLILIKMELLITDQEQSVLNLPVTRTMVKKIEMKIYTIWKLWNQQRKIQTIDTQLGDLNWIFQPE